MKKLIITTIISSLINLSLSLNVRAEESLVGFGGIYSLENKNNKFDNFNRNKKELVTKIRATLEKLNNENKLPFKILFETDAESIKGRIDDNVYSLALVITRDDISNEKFEIPESNILLNKSYINVGMVAVLYQTTDDLIQKGKKKNSVIFSFPIVGYSISVKQNQTLTTSELDNSFINIASNVLEEELVNKLQKISVDELNGKVKEIKNNQVLIDIGSSSGLILGQKIKILSEDKVIKKGKIEKLSLNESLISFDDKNISDIKVGYQIKTSNIKGLSDETYQVVNLKISSEKFKKLFSEDDISIQVSQWFSDFLSERSGKVVLPPKIGSNWVESSNQQTFAVFIKDGQEHLFEIAKPKYEVSLDITGMSSKRIEDESNNVNENRAFKLWLKVEIPNKNYSKEFDKLSAKSIIVGTQSFEEKAEFFDLLHQLTAKASKEIE